MSDADHEIDNTSRFLERTDMHIELRSQFGRSINDHASEASPITLILLRVSSPLSQRRAVFHLHKCY